MRLLIIAVLCFFAVSASAQDGSRPVLSTSANGDFAGPYFGLSVGAFRSDFSRNSCCPGPEDYRAEPAISANLGYNWVFDNALIGLETDFTLTSVAAKENAAFGFGPVEHHQHASLRARAGFFVGEGTLLYGTAGMGWLHVDFGGDSKWVSGAIGGIGVESASFAERIGIPGWRIKAEALFQHAEETEFSQFGTSVFSASDNYIFRIGLNKNF